MVGCGRRCTSINTYVEYGFSSAVFKARRYTIQPVFKSMCAGVRVEWACVPAVVRIVTVKVGVLNVKNASVMERHFGADNPLLSIKEFILLSHIDTHSIQKNKNKGEHGR